MCHRNNVLAIPRGHPPPRQLPAKFHNYVTVVEIIDSPFPGYVTLELGYVLTQSSHHDNYNALSWLRDLGARLRTNAIQSS